MGCECEQCTGKRTNGETRKKSHDYDKDLCSKQFLFF